MQRIFAHSASSHPLFDIVYGCISLNNFRESINQGCSRQVTFSYRCQNFTLHYDRCATARRNCDLLVSRHCETI